MLFSEVQPFNSLSRDHIVCVLIVVDDPGAMNPTFNSLSRDHTRTSAFTSSKSTASSCFQLPLSGSQRSEGSVIPLSDAAKAFNSLSRDHGITRCAARKALPHVGERFQLPLSGSL